MQRIWVLNHYATKQYTQAGGRHYWLSRKLVERGYTAEIFSASTIHGASTTQQIQGTRFLDGVRFRFLRTPHYKTRVQRLRNIVAFYCQLMRVGKRATTPPDIIYASSVHPLTLLAGIRLAKYHKVPCICEVRDLWPLSIEAYAPKLRGTLLTRVLYRGEHWLYRQADELIFTMEGGEQYLSDRGWSNTIETAKVHYINNGVDLPSFDKLAVTEEVSDVDLDNAEIFKVVYAGSVRHVNNIDVLLDVAKELDARGVTDVKLLIYGDGDKRAELEERAVGVGSISFKGPIPKQSIPNLLSKADAVIFHGDQGVLSKYGTSMNKLFEYFASGTPVISDCRFGFDPIELNNCGLVVPNGSPSDLADSILALKSLSSTEYTSMALRARNAAEQYDFGALADKLEHVIKQARASTKH